MMENRYVYLREYLQNKLFTTAYSKMPSYGFSYISFKSGVMVFEKENDYNDEDFEKMILIVSNETAEIVETHFIEFHYLCPHDDDFILCDYSVYDNGKYIGEATF